MVWGSPLIKKNQGSPTAPAEEIMVSFAKIPAALKRLTFQASEADPSRP